MGAQTIEEYNNGHILVGNGRGAWWNDLASRADLESPFYDGAIPLADAIRRVFYWDILSAPVGYTALVNGEETYRETTDQVIYRSDNGEALKTGFKSGYEIHQYRDVLLDWASRITGVSIADAVNMDNGTSADMLQLSTVGSLFHGRAAWAQFTLPNIVKSKQGVEFSTSLLLGTSCDGTIATGAKLVNTVVVCDNTWQAARGESGAGVKIKHSKYSQARFDGAADYLQIATVQADAFASEVDELIATPVSGLQFRKFIDAYVPIGDDAAKIAITKGEAKRDLLIDLYGTDDRVNPWAGSAFGVMQMVNTFNQWVAPIHAGTDRFEKTINDSLTGKLDARDDAALELLTSILANV